MVGDKKRLETALVEFDSLKTRTDETSLFWSLLEIYAHILHILQHVQDGDISYASLRLPQLHSLLEKTPLDTPLPMLNSITCRKLYLVTYLISGMIHLPGENSKAKTFLLEGFKAVQCILTYALN